MTEEGKGDRLAELYAAGDEALERAEERAEADTAEARRKAREAAEDARREELLERAGKWVDSIRPRLPRNDALAVAANALEVDPEHAKEWLELASRTGGKAANTLLRGGRAGIAGREEAKRAIDARQKEAENAEGWLKDQGRMAPVVRPRRPLLIAPQEERTEERTHGSYLPGGLVGMVVASGGTGKTTWAAELAMRVAWNDEEGAGKAEVPPVSLAEKRDADDPTHGRVLLLLAEEDQDGASAAVLRGLRKVVGEKRAEELVQSSAWPERVRMLAGADRNTALAMQVQLEDPVRGRVIRFTPSPLAEALFRIAEEHGPLLTILDPVNQLLPTGASENDATAAAAVVSLAGQLRARAEEGLRKRWAEETGRDSEEYDGPRPVVLLVHHESKAARADGAAGAGAARGSSAWTDNVRWVLRMTREKTEGAPTALTWAVEKSNYARQWTHTAALVEGEDGLAWRQWTDTDTKAVERVRAEKAKRAGRNPEALHTVEALLAALEGDWMTESEAKKEHGREAVREALESGQAAKVPVGGGYRLYLAGKQPTEEGGVKAAPKRPLLDPELL